MNIAFCSNQIALIGLGPTVSSLISNCSDSSKLSLWFLCAGLNDKDKNNIKRLVESAHFRGKLFFIDFDPVAEFGNFRSLHGDWTTYGRLLLAELLDTEENVLYLDSDLIIEIDVLMIEEFDFKDKALAVVQGGSLNYALDHDFLNGKLGLPLDSHYFNAGVIFFNLTKWRANNLKEQCLNIARKYPNDLLSVDQTILNAVFNSNYEYLPAEFNCQWVANWERPEVAKKMILHFVGSPKPWDSFGRQLHNGYDTWVKNLSYEWARSYYKKGIKDAIRLWNIRKSYFRTLKAILIEKQNHLKMAK
jgi:lipopolysaccharide biosynthesis glycosyltransferase